MGLLSSLFGGGKTGKATMRAAEQNRDLIHGFNRQATGYLDRGLDASKGYLTEARDLYSPLIELGQRGTNLYSDALGLNGAAGNANAQSAFQTSPGFGFMMDQGLQALERSAAAQGRLQSGQTGIDTLGFAQGLANQEWNSYLDRLSGFGGMWQGGVAGQAGALGSLSDLFQNDAGNRVGLAGQVTSGLMGANNMYADGREKREAAKTSGLGSLLGLGATILGGGLGGIGGAVGGGTTLGSIGRGVGNALTGYGTGNWGYGR